MNESPEPRSKGRPSLEEAAEIDRTILNAARKILFEHGEAATINAVAKAAGLSRKSLYARYPGKSELFVAAVRQMLQDVGAVGYPARGSFRQRLQEYVKATLELVSSSGAMSFHRAMSINPTVIADLKPELLAATQRIFLEPLTQLLIEGREAGDISCNDPAGIATIIASAILSPGLMMDVDGGNPPGLETLQLRARQLTELFAHGLLPR